MLVIISAFLAEEGALQVQGPRLQAQVSEGGTIRLETLLELKFLDSSFSSSNISIRAFRAYYLVEIRQTILCRAFRGNSISVNSILPPSLGDQIIREIRVSRKAAYWLQWDPKPETRNPRRKLLVCSA